MLVRSLLRAPAWTALVVITLGLGIGANTVLWSIVYAVLLEPFGYGVPGERLVAVFEEDLARDEHRNPTSPASFRDWSRARSLEEWTAARPWSPVLVGAGAPEQVKGLKASPSLFRLLGASAALGSTFETEGAAAEEARVLVLGDGLWHRLFAGDPRVVGRSVTLDREVYTVIGVMPPGFRFPPFWAGDAELWTPLALDSADRSMFLRVFARLRPGTSLAGAQAEMATLGESLERQFPRENAGIGIRVEPLREPTVSGVRVALLALFASTGMVLLIACANVANLALVRANGRRSELALRAALGAGRGRLLGEQLAESAALAFAGGALGALLAAWGIEALAGLLPADFPRRFEIALDGSALLFTAAASAVAGCLFGLLPALSTVGRDLASAAGSSRNQRSSAARGRARRMLVVAEVALSLMLVVGAGLLGRSLLRLLHVDPGYASAGTLTFDLSFAASGRAQAERQADFLDEVAREVGALPGVARCGLINHLPIGGDLWRTPFTVEGVEPAAEPLRAAQRTVSPTYRAAMGVPLLAGRDLGELDAERSLPVVLINRTLAERYFPPGRAVEGRLKLGGGGSEGAWRTVVGVVGDVHQVSLADEVRPEIYFPYRQNPVSFYRQTTLVVRPAGDPGTVAASVRERLRRLDPGLAVSDAVPLSRRVLASADAPRFNALLANLFAGLALLLAGVGVYGVMSYGVAERSSEIGLRMALGAGRREILRLVLWQSMRLAGAGVGLGLVGALAGAWLLRGLLFGVQVYDGVTFLGASLLVVLAGAAASYLPALRATRVDPLVNLRLD